MRTTRQMIDEKVNSINNLLQDESGEYRVTNSPHYGGYNFYFSRHGDSAHHCGYFGFDYRISGKEMFRYLTGIVLALNLKNNN